MTAVDKALNIIYIFSGNSETSNAEVSREKGIFFR